MLDNVGTGDLFARRVCRHRRGGGAVAMTIASARGGFASVTGSIVDPMDAAMPGVTLVLTNVAREAKYQVRTDGSGRYEFVGLPPGEYLFEAKLPGFATFKGKMTVAGQNVRRDLKMDVGTLQETITVGEQQVRAVGRRLSALPRRLAGRHRRRHATGTPAAGGVRIGGSVRPPMKLKDVHGRSIHRSSRRRAWRGPSRSRDGSEPTASSRISRSFRRLTPIWHRPPWTPCAEWEFSTTLLNCKPVVVLIGYQRELHAEALTRSTDLHDPRWPSTSQRQEWPGSPMRPRLTSIRSCSRVRRRRLEGSILLRFGTHPSSPTAARLRPHAAGYRDTKSLASGGVLFGETRCCVACSKAYAIAINRG